MRLSASDAAAIDAGTKTIEQIQRERVTAIREALADYAHSAWSGWMLWLFEHGTQNPDGTFTINADKVERWRRQATTDYADLPNDEQESDRIEARRILAVLDNATKPAK